MTSARFAPGHRRLAARTRAPTATQLAAKLSHAGADCAAGAPGAGGGVQLCCWLPPDEAAELAAAMGAAGAAWVPASTSCAT